jgi:Cu+-exporting ATPase
MDHQHGTALPVVDPSVGMAVDPVCGMTVDPEAARATGRFSQYKGVDYFFCSRGCKLDFDEEPERYLDPTYEPSM